MRSANKSTYTFTVEDDNGKTITLTCKGHLSQQTYFDHDEVVHQIQCDKFEMKLKK